MTSDASASLIPVTLLTGVLGNGKTFRAFRQVLPQTMESAW
jgi:hypothetical protein